MALISVFIVVLNLWSILDMCVSTRQSGDFAAF